MPPSSHDSRGKGTIWSIRHSARKRGSAVMSSFSFLSGSLGRQPGRDEQAAPGVEVFAGPGMALVGRTVAEDHVRQPGVLVAEDVLVEEGGQVGGEGHDQ